MSHLDPSHAAAVVPYIEDSACLQCDRCQVARACLFKAVIRIDRDEAPFIDGHRCNGCLSCIQVCPAGAVKVPER